MGKKSRRNRDKSDYTIKSLQERKKEVTIVKEKIQELGFGDGNPDIKSFLKLLENYSNNLESYQGKIKVNGYQRIIEYILPRYNKNKCQVKMVYDKSI